MRYVFASWAIPFGLFWAWYFLSLNDISFGYIMLTREVHDLVFRLYGEVLGIDPQALPAMVARACAIDTAIILGIWAFRRRREIRAWWARKRDQNAAGTALSGLPMYGAPQAGQAPPAE